MRHGWTLEKDKWDDLCSVIPDRKWVETRLDPLYQDVVPPEPGVYAICATAPISDSELSSHLYNVVYVGQDGCSLRRRFLEHCRRPKRDVLAVKHCFGWLLDYWFVVLDSSDTDRFEAAMIDCFGPCGNRIRGRIKATVGTPKSLGKQRKGVRR